MGHYCPWPFEMAKLLYTKEGNVTRSQTRTAATRDTAIKECLPWDFLAVISLIIHHTVWQIAIFGK